MSRRQQLDRPRRSVVNDEHTDANNDGHDAAPPYDGHATTSHPTQRAGGSPSRARAYVWRVVGVRVDFKPVATAPDAKGERAEKALALLTDVERCYKDARCAAAASRRAVHDRRGPDGAALKLAEGSKKRQSSQRRRSVAAG